MSRDRIFLIEPGFEDPQSPGELFVCPHCNAIEGLLAAFPDRAARLDIQRVPFPRPRVPVIAVVSTTLPAGTVSSRSAISFRSPALCLTPITPDSSLMMRTSSDGLR